MRSFEAKSSELESVTLRADVRSSVVQTLNRMQGEINIFFSHKASGLSKQAAVV